MSPIAYGESDLFLEQSEVSWNLEDSVLLCIVFATCIGK